MFNKFKFLFFESIKSIGRTKLQSIVSSLAIAVSLIVLSLSYCLYIFLSDFKSDVSDIYKIEVFFKDKTCMNKLYAEHLNILEIEGIYSGQFSKGSDTGYLLNEKHGNNIFDVSIKTRNSVLEILENSTLDNECKECSSIVDECDCYEYTCDSELFSERSNCWWDTNTDKCTIRTNPLSMYAIYTISEEFREIEQIENIINTINDKENINEVICNIEGLTMVNNGIQSIYSFLFIIGIVICVVAIFYVSNTILLIIYSRNEDIEILKLLGASNNFIKFPYILEGIIIGLLGAVLSIIIVGFFYYILVYFLDTNSGSIYNLRLIILSNFAVGSFLGFLGSSRALSSYMKK